MKDSGIEWIGEIPDDWKVNKIDSLYSLRSTKVNDVDYPPLSVTMKGIVPQLATAAKTDDHDNRKLVKKGDFAINSRSDRRGSCGISDYDGSVSLINIVLTPRGQMNPRYYNWLFHTEQFADEFYKWGHGIVNDLWTTRWQDMKHIFIVSPSLDEQKKIADYLDDRCSKIDELITGTIASIEDYKKLKQSIITEAVTKGLNKDVPMKDSGVEWIGEIPKEWKVLLLKFLCNMQAGKNLVSEDISDSGEYPVYGGNGLRGYFSKYNTEGQNILVGRQGALCGNVHMVDGQYWCTEHAVVTTPSSLVVLDYLYFLLIAMDLNQYSSNTAVQPGLSVNKILHIKTVLPPLSEQKEIANYLDKKVKNIDDIINEKTGLIEDLKAYKKSLIYEVVTGKKEVK